MKKGLFYILVVFLAGFFIHFLINFQSHQRASLKILTYSSFAGVYGPGPAIQSEFERICNCQLQWFLVEDSTALLQRFVFLPEIDMVIGWDQITWPLDPKGLWEDLSFLKSFLSIESPFLKNSFFIPLDWSPIGFIYKKSEYKRSSLKSLKNFKARISFPEPRASTLGLQFYYWIYEAFNGDKDSISQFLKELKTQVYGPVFSWSLAYGFFKRGQTQMALSYLSSLLYHQKEEPDQSYFFAEFKEGHPYQLEFFSVSQNSKNKNLALKFAEFLLSKRAQEILLKKHYMFPVSNQLSLDFPAHLKKPKLLSYKKLEEFIKNKENLLELWEENLH
ncbi:MAG: thiamine ABC transporter substrate-binding protein [Oligoflexia bacterium]|nr:thiamine ABC transporter substrate-binding protein [Oligoflexia bacterium]